MGIRQRWKQKGGYREALVIGLPLVISMISMTVMTFTDRIFLGNYSLEALGASVPAHMAAFLFLSFFMGVTEYIGVFIAQFTGSTQHEKVGKALWQGLWFTLPSGILLAALWFLAEPLFIWGGHPPAIRELEIVYFRILTVGSGFFLAGICLSNFYSGRGLTKTVMMVSITGMIVNIPLDYCLINGVGPFPELGIAGAGIATVIGFILPVVIYGYLIFTRENEAIFRVRSAWRLDRALFTRFLRFGLPGGVEFFLDIFAVSFFVFMVGRFGQVELASTSAVFSIYNLAFLPTIGLHVATSVMVGQAMGDRNPELAAYATKSVLHIALTYMGLMAVIFVLWPEYLLNLFRAHQESGASFDAVVDMGVVLMRYCAVFTLIDAVAIIYIGGLKGAGDTRVSMLMMGTASVVCMVIPLTVINQMGWSSIHGPWLCLLAYVVVLASSFMIRFRLGPWRKIELIPYEEPPEMG